MSVGVSMKKWVVGSGFGVYTCSQSTAVQFFMTYSQCFFCKTIFSGTHILIFDWRPQYSMSLRQ